MGNTKLANPAPLGLMGFGMTTILLNLHNIGMFPMDVLSWRWAFFTAVSRKSSRACWNIKRQYLRFNRLYLLRFFLADAGRHSADA
jgi:hypothetical protein